MCGTEEKNTKQSAEWTSQKDSKQFEEYNKNQNTANRAKELIRFDVLEKFSRLFFIKKLNVYKLSK